MDIETLEDTLHGAEERAKFAAERAGAATPSDAA